MLKSSMQSPKAAAQNGGGLYEWAHGYPLAHCSSACGAAIYGGVFSNEGRQVKLLITMISLAFSGAALSETSLESELAAARHMYQAEYRTGDLEAARPSDILNFARCTSPIPGEPLPLIPGMDDVLSSGDLVTIHIEQDELLNGQYVVSYDGYLHLPFLPPVLVLGKSSAGIEAYLAAVLLAEGFYSTPPRVSVRLTDLAEAQVFVSGAVFEPGAFVIGGNTAETRDLARQSASGAAGFGRNLTRALANAGGIRPDADLAHILVLRQGETTVVDLRPVIVGQAFNNMLLVTGDEITVPSLDCFQAELMVPSTITPPGVKVFMSNLTKPAASNAQSNIGKEARELRYGTRFLQAVVGMNCAGGALRGNANRTVALYSRNPLTGESILVEWLFEELLRRTDRDEYDPYLLPGDSLFCYDAR